MNHERARELLAAERQRVEALLRDTRAGAELDIEAAAETGDIADSAEPLTGEEVQQSIAEELERRLAAIGRAERRLDDGTYGRSVRSGAPIPDERLAADPAAELTAEEAAAG